jgi:hypothetical protein
MISIADTSVTIQTSSQSVPYFGVGSVLLLASYCYYTYLALPGKPCRIPQKCQRYESTLPRYVRNLSPPTHFSKLLNIVQNYLRKNILNKGESLS